VASRKQILSVLGLITDYYRHPLSESELGVYLSHLADLDPYQLRSAADSWIDQSPYFPRISDLRAAAAKQPPTHPDLFFHEADELRDAFFREGYMDPDAWEDLARRLERYDYIEYAAMVRQKCHRLCTEYDENGHLKPEIEEKHRKSWERFLNSDLKSEEEED